jgi:hypothetical protein
MVDVAEAVTDLSALSRVVLATPPTTAVATPISSTRIDVSWPTVVMAGAYRVYRNGVLVDEVEGLSSSSTGLTPSTLYSFQISSLLEDGQEGVKGSQFTATTLPIPDTIAPSVPVIAVTTLSSSSQRVSLTTASTDTGGSGLSSYTLQRATDAAFTLNLVSQTVATNGFPVSASVLLPSTQYFYRCRAVDGAGNVSNFSATVNATTLSGSNQPPQWVTPPNQSLVLGVPYSLTLQAPDPEAQPVTFTISGSLPAGLTQSGTRGETISGTPTTVQVTTPSITADDASSSSEETDHAAVSAQVLALGGLVQDFDFASRAALMSFAQTQVAEGGGTRFSYAPGDPVGDPAYQDPVPVGTVEKISLDTSVYLTKGRSVYNRLLASEGATEAGPTMEFLIPTPSPINYYCAILRMDPIILSHDYGTPDGRKIFFLDELSFSTGQIVFTLSSSGPWLTGYRLFGGAIGFRNNHSVGPSPYGQNWTLLTGYETQPGAPEPTTASAYDQRWGPSRDNPSGTDPDFAAVERFTGGVWTAFMIMTDQTYVGSISRGMVKAWMSHKDPTTGIWTPPQMQHCVFRDAKLLPFANPPTDLVTRAAQSFRLTFRPEDATIGQPTDGGIHWDRIYWAPGPFNMPGGYTPPYQGQAIPPGFPIANTTDD